jgi:hypothetical protein
MKRSTKRFAGVFAVRGRNEVQAAEDSQAYEAGMATRATAATAAAAAVAAVAASDEFRDLGRRRGGKALRKEFLPKLRHRQPRSLARRLGNPARSPS